MSYMGEWVRDRIWDQTYYRIRCQVDRSVRVQAWDSVEPSDQIPNMVAAQIRDEL